MSQFEHYLARVPFLNLGFLTLYCRENFSILLMAVKISEGAVIVTLLAN